MKKKRLMFFIALILFAVKILLPDISTASSDQKLIIITVDQLEIEEFLQVNKIKSAGLLSMVAGARSDLNESLMMSMAVGRRVKISDHISTSTKEKEGAIEVIGYQDILDDLDTEYKDFSKTMPFLGSTLFDNGIKRAYLGKGSDALLLANRQGLIDYGVARISYDYDWLSKELERLTSKADVLHLSYDIGGSLERRELLGELINSREESIMLISKSVPESMEHGLNKTLTPIFIINDSSGILSSSSTRRRGVVSNLDIKPSILAMYGLDDNLAIGNPIDTLSSESPEKELEDILGGFINLGIAKYIFHGIIIFAQLLLIYLILFKEDRLYRFGWILILPSTLLMISVATSISSMYRHWYIYAPVILLIGVFISRYFYRQGFKTIEEIATITNIAIISMAIINFEYVYNSFIGYNNIVAGGRFYGFNNDIMGVFIATSILSYYYISDKLKPLNKLFFTIIYLTTLVVINSGLYGSNFGGLLTSIFLSGSIVYLEYLNKKIGKKTIIIVGLAIIATLGLSTYLMGGRGHIGEFFIRVNRYGFTEFVSMIEVKLRQLLFMALVPPWSIMLITQSVFALIFIRKKKIALDKDYRYMVIFLTAIFALLVNDTGVVSFVYIMSYLVSAVGLQLIREGRE